MKAGVKNIRGKKINLSLASHRMIFLLLMGKGPDIPCNSLSDYTIRKINGQSHQIMTFNKNMTGNLKKLEEYVRICHQDR